LRPRLTALDSANVTDETHATEVEHVVSASSSSDGATGGGEPDEVSGSAAKSPKKSYQWVFIAALAVVVIADGALLSARFLFTHSASDLPPGLSLTALEARVQQQVRAPATDEGFDETAAHSTRCVMSGPWTPGRTFTCLVFDARGSELGKFIGTEVAFQGKRPRWYSYWMPAKKSGTKSTTPTTSHT
jgi:hypothetical protein